MKPKVEDLFGDPYIMKSVVEPRDEALEPDLKMDCGNVLVYLLTNRIFMEIFLSKKNVSEYIIIVKIIFLSCK